VLRWLPLVALVTAALFSWFVIAFMSDNDTAWTTSEPIQILTGLGVIAGLVAMLAVLVTALLRSIRSRRDPLC
jgi:hypothetical protein